MKTYYVYILSNRTRTTYTGIIGDLEGRVMQHKSGEIEGFTKKYGIDKLVYYEEFEDVHGAIEREKQIKAWRREKKVKLIKSMNPKWDDLSNGWGNY